MVHPLDTNMISESSQPQNRHQIPCWKWGLFVFSLLSISGLGIFSFFNPELTVELLKKYTFECIAGVSYSGLLMGVFITYLILKRQSGLSEKNKYQKLASWAAIALIFTLVLASLILTSEMQNLIFSSDVKFLQDLISSPLIIPIIFGTGALAGGLGYYGFIYRHKHFLDDAYDLSNEEARWATVTARSLEREDEERFHFTIGASFEELLFKEKEQLQSNE